MRGMRETRDTRERLRGKKGGREERREGRREGEQHEKARQSEG